MNPAAGLVVSLKIPKNRIRGFLYVRSFESGIWFDFFTNLGFFFGKNVMSFRILGQNPQNGFSKNGVLPGGGGDFPIGSVWDCPLRIRDFSPEPILFFLDGMFRPSNLLESGRVWILRDSFISGFSVSISGSSLGYLYLRPVRVNSLERSAFPTTVFLICLEFCDICFLYKTYI